MPKDDGVHNYFFGGLPEMPWKKENKEMNNYKLAELERIVERIKEWAYQNEVLDTGMEDLWVGESGIYNDKDDWKESWIEQFNDENWSD